MNRREMAHVWAFSSHCRLVKTIDDEIHVLTWRKARRDCSGEAFHELVERLRRPEVHALPCDVIPCCATIFFVFRQDIQSKLLWRSLHDPTHSCDTDICNFPASKISGI